MQPNSHDTTKQRILSEARRAFADRGNEAVGIQEICRAADVTKPTLYYHFGNKDGLLAAVCSDAASAFLETVARPIAYTGDIVSDVREMLATIASFAITANDQFRLVLQMLYAPPGSTLGARSRDDVVAIVDAFEGFFHNARDDHGNLRGKERHLAIAFLGHAVAFTSAFEAHSPPQVDSEPVIQAAQTFLYGIF